MRGVGGVSTATQASDPRALQRAPPPSSGHEGSGGSASTLHTPRTHSSTSTPGLERSHRRKAKTLEPGPKSSHANERRLLRRPGPDVPGTDVTAPHAGENESPEGRVTERAKVLSLQSSLLEMTKVIAET